MRDANNHYFSVQLSLIRDLRISKAILSPSLVRGEKFSVKLFW